MAGHKGPLRTAIEDFFATFGPISRWLRGGSISGRAGIGVDDSEILRAVSNKIQANPDLPAWYKNLHAIKGVDEDEGMAAKKLLLWATTLAGGMFGAVTPAARIAGYAVENELTTARPDPATAWAMKWRGVEREDWRELLSNLGWHDDLIDAFEEILRPRLSPPDMFQHMRLTGVEPADVYNELAKRGYTAEDVGAMSKLAQMVPGPADLIKMAVREAWRDDVAGQYGYDADFPAEFGDWMKKQGDTENWAQKYWRAHWDLPGLNTVLEILYRVPGFDIADLKDYLRTADVPSAWRDWIAQTAYRPLTRVDVRRMYGMGVLDRPAVKKSYLDLGYDDANAEAMTEFTVRYETEEDRAATKTDILSFYNVGSLTAGEAVAWLKAIGYPDDLATYLVAREQTKAEQKLVDKQAKHIGDLYVHGEITAPDARARLAAAGVPAGEVQRLMEGWDIDHEQKVERPSRATLDKLFGQDVITEADYTNGLRGLGYQDQYVNWYLQSILQIKTEEARKEEEAARKEQDDIRERAIKSNYQVDKAQLDVDIAEVTTAIGETQLALRERQVRYQNELRTAKDALPAAEVRELARFDIASLEAQIDEQKEVLAYLRSQIEELQTLIADINVRATPQTKTLTIGEAAVAEREREVAIGELKVEIEAFQTEVATIKLDQAEEVPTLTPEEADVAILERGVAIEMLQDDIAVLEVEITAIQLEREIVVVELDPEEADRQIVALRLTIEHTQDSISEVNATIAQLAVQIRVRGEQMQRDLLIVARLRDIEDVEGEWRTAQMEMIERLSVLRGNLSALREQKAQLTVEYREGIAEEV